MGKGEVLTEQPSPTVAEATKDRAPPLRANHVLVNNSEYNVGSRSQEFSERYLPLTDSGDTLVMGEQEAQEAMASIAFGNESLSIPSSEDLPNNVADPEAVGREAKQKVLMAVKQRADAMRDDLEDPKLLDVIGRLLSHPKREKICLTPSGLQAVSEIGRQCGGGGGGGGKGQASHAESSSGQKSQANVGQSSLVVGGIGRGGGGGGLGGGGGDDDPNDRRPYNLPPSHYNEFTGYEEEATTEDELLRHAMTQLEEGMTRDPMVSDPFFSQFTKPHEEPLSTSLVDCVRPIDLAESMDLDVDAFSDPNDLSQYLLPEPVVEPMVEPMFEPAEESSSQNEAQMPLNFDLLQQAPQALVEAVQPQSEPAPSQAVLPLPQSAVAHHSTTSYQATEETSDIESSIELIHLMKPSTIKRPGKQMLRVSDNVVSYSGVTPTTPYPPPSPAGSVYSNMAATPSPLPPPTPSTPAASPCPPTPSTPGTPAVRRSCGPFVSETSTSDGVRLFQLSLSLDSPRHVYSRAIQAMLYIETYYSCVFQKAEDEIDLKVASDVHAKMCQFTFDKQELKMTLTMPKDCQRLEKWLKTNPDLKDRMLVMQQILNTIATIHTRGHEDNLSLFGSFMVFVASDMRVYILVDFTVVLRKQEELSAQGMNDPRILDVMALRQIFNNVIPTCIGKDNSWVSPGLRSVLDSFEMLLGDTRSSCRVAEAARTLGEKRVCKVEVNMGLPVVFYCLEREELQTALKHLSHIVPGNISETWVVERLHNGTSYRDFMRVGDIVTADRRMLLRLCPVQHVSDARLLYITSSSPPHRPH